jgi:two-component system CheB/CheR fusion protein
MSENDAAFEALLEFLKRTRGIDFMGYKRTSLQRRVRRRMEVVGCDSFGDHLDHLEGAPMEYEQLFEMSRTPRSRGSTCSYAATR